MQKNTFPNKRRPAAKPEPIASRTINRSHAHQPEPVRRAQHIEAWQIQTVAHFSARASWYVTVIHALTGQPVMVTQEGRKRYLSVGSFAGDALVSGIEVGVDETLRKGDPLEQGLEVLCNRVCKVARKRAQALTFDDLWGIAV